MRYFDSTLHDAKVRIDTESDKAYITYGEEEILAKSGSKVVADATIEGKEISEEEYYS